MCFRCRASIPTSPGIWSPHCHRRPTPPSRSGSCRLARGRPLRRRAAHFGGQGWASNPVGKVNVRVREPNMRRRPQEKSVPPPDLGYLGFFFPLMRLVVLSIWGAYVRHNIRDSCSVYHQRRSQPKTTKARTRRTTLPITICASSWNLCRAFFLET